MDEFQKYGQQIRQKMTVFHSAYKKCIPGKLKRTRELPTSLQSDSYDCAALCLLSAKRDIFSKAGLDIAKCRAFPLIAQLGQKEPERANGVGVHEPRFVGALQIAERRRVRIRRTLIRFAGGRPPSRQGILAAWERRHTPSSACQGPSSIPSGAGSFPCGASTLRSSPFPRVRRCSGCACPDSI